MRGQGAKPKWRGKPGDLIITVQVSPHPYFRRRGSELYLDVPITVAEAASGAKIDIPTPDGAITLTVPPGTSSGQRLRVRQRGVPSPSGKRGDMYAEMQIVLPKQLDEESLELFRQLGSKYQEHPRENLCW